MMHPKFEALVDLLRACDVNGEEDVAQSVLELLTGDDPFAAADDAIRALLQHDGRTVAAWALVADVQRLDPLVPPDVSPLEHGIDYAVSAALSPSHALGLTESLATRLRRVVRVAFVDEE